MEKVKVSREVAKAIEFTLKGFCKEMILDAHKRNPKGWKLPGNQALNTIDYDMLKQALEDGYEVTEYPTDALLECIKYLKTIGFNNEDILFRHKECGWHDTKNRILNEVSYEALEMLLGIGDKRQKLIQQSSSSEELQAELDYELASLHDAMERGDTAEIERSKRRLAEIHKEMEGAK